MDLIIFDKDMKEISPVNVEVDFEIGDVDAKNDFEITSTYLGAYGIYSPGTEMGGIFERNEYTSNSSTITTGGLTFRGLLEDAIILPPTGSDYRIVSGDANTIIKDICQDLFGGFFSFPDSLSGITIKSYQFKLYTTVLEGLMDMLEENNARLHIHAEKDAPGGIVKIYLEAVQATTVSSVFDEDTNLSMTLTDDQTGINHLICGGEGELQNRLIVHLYVDKDGNIGRTQYYTGFKERTAFYDYSSANDETTLVKNGTERLQKLQSSTSLSVDAPEEELEIGDFVRGQKRDVGVTFTAPIIKKIVKVTMAKTTIEYQTRETN